MKSIAVSLILAISMLVGVDLFAQTPDRFRFGVIAGTQVTHARLQSSEYYYTNAAPEKLGWIVGTSGQFDIVDKLTLDVFMGLSHDATHVDGTYYTSYNDLYHPIEENQDFTWIENTVSLMYKYLNKPTLSLYAGLGIATHYLIKSQGQTATDQAKNPVYDSTDEMLKWNYALPVAARVEFSVGDKKLSCTFSYHVGLRGAYAPISIQLQGDPPTYLLEDGIYRLNAASLTVAYLVPLGK